MHTFDLLSADPSNMYANIRAFPDHLIQGKIIGQSFDLEKVKTRNIGSIVVAGMGGSAIAGDLLLGCLRHELSVPFEVWRDYDLPDYSGSETLVICSSYSGDTAETLSAFWRAIEKGSNVIAITSGGKLAQLAFDNGFPVLLIPPGLPPRAALGYSFAPLLIVLGKLGLCRDYSMELNQAAESVREDGLMYLVESYANKALQLAEKIRGKTIIIYTGGGLLRGAGVRFKGQICENAKQPAFCNQIPEMNHNELVGWQNHEVVASRFAIILLQDTEDHPQVRRRFEVSAELLKSRGMEVHSIEFESGSRLTRLLRVVHLVDFVSFYLALLNKVDPTPVEFINYLKKKIS